MRCSLQNKSSNILSDHCMQRPQRPRIAAEDRGANLFFDCSEAMDCENRDRKKTYYATPSIMGAAQGFWHFLYKREEKEGEIQNLEHVMYLHTYAFACLRLHYTYSACIIEYKVLKPTEIPPTNNLLQIDAQKGWQNVVHIGSVSKKSFAIKCTPAFPNAFKESALTSTAVVCYAAHWGDSSFSKTCLGQVPCRSFELSQWNSSLLAPEVSSDRTPNGSNNST